MLFRGFWLRLSGFRDLGLGFRVYGFRVFRVKGLVFEGFRVLGFRV